MHVNYNKSNSLHLFHYNSKSLQNKHVCGLSSFLTVLMPLAFFVQLDIFSQCCQFLLFCPGMYHGPFLNEECKSRNRGWTSKAHLDSKSEGETLSLVHLSHL